MKLSIVTGTLNRLEHLKRCIASVRVSCVKLEHEIIIVDGGSTDGSLEWLRAQKDVTLIEQGEPLGAVAAFNAGFAQAQGEYVAAFNDDAEVVGDTYLRAVKYLDTNPKVGQLAIPFGYPNAMPEVQSVNALNKRFVYANFSVTRRELGERVGWWGDFYQYAGDTRLSIEIVKLGFMVVPLDGGAIIHHQVHDATRKPNIESPRLGYLYSPRVRAQITFETQREAREHARERQRQNQARARTALNRRRGR